MVHIHLLRDSVRKEVLENSSKEDAGLVFPSCLLLGGGGMTYDVEPTAPLQLTRVEITQPNMISIAC
jgi:hypothetical protein